MLSLRSATHYFIGKHNLSVSRNFSHIKNIYVIPKLTFPSTKRISGFVIIWNLFSNTSTSIVKLKLILYSKHYTQAKLNNKLNIKFQCALFIPTLYYKLSNTRYISNAMYIIVTISISTNSFFGNQGKNVANTLLSGLEYTPVNSPKACYAPAYFYTGTQRMERMSWQKWPIFCRRHFKLHVHEYIKIIFSFEYH